MKASIEGTLTQLALISMIYLIYLLIQQVNQARIPPNRTGAAVWPPAKGLKAA